MAQRFREEGVDGLRDRPSRPSDNLQRFDQHGAARLCLQLLIVMVGLVPAKRLRNRP
jgi:hypothetical protein